MIWRMVLCLALMSGAGAASAQGPAPPQPASSTAAQPPLCEGVAAPVGNETRCLRPGSGKTEWFKDCPECPDMVVVPAGSFAMGSSESEEQRQTAEGPQHEVTIGKVFAVARFAVTRNQFEAFVRETSHSMGDACWAFMNDKAEEVAGRSFRNPGFAQDGRHPVVCVSWDDAQAFAAWLSKKTGKAYRLLTEAEREYVARAGSTTPFWWGPSIATSQANYDGNATCGGGPVGEWREKTLPVESFEANPWGLYQVHGNVFDWVEDCWNDSYQGAPTDGSAWTTGDCARRVVRGGSWYYYPRFLRSASRIGDPSRHGYASYGFRLARTLNP